jgi:hypothetical protein
VQNISIIEFIEQTGRKEQVEGGKSGEKNHDEDDSLRKDRISK